MDTVMVLSRECAISCVHHPGSAPPFLSVAEVRKAWSDGKPATVLHSRCGCQGHQLTECLPEYQEKWPPGRRRCGSQSFSLNLA